MIALHYWRSHRDIVWCAIVSEHDVVAVGAVALHLGWSPRPVVVVVVRTQVLIDFLYLLHHPSDAFEVLKFDACTGFVLAVGE